jgi:hypothetical protein
VDGSGHTSRSIPWPSQNTKYIRQGLETRLIETIMEVYLTTPILEGFIAKQPGPAGTHQTIEMETSRINDAGGNYRTKIAVVGKDSTVSV